MRLSLPSLSTAPSVCSGAPRPLPPQHAPPCKHAATAKRGINSSSRLITSGLRDNLKGLLSGVGPAGQTYQPEAPPDEGGTMVSINAETRGITGEAAFGPLAVLVIGFLPEELKAFSGLLQDMEAGIVKVIPCTKAMLSGTLKEALEVESAPVYETPALGQRRALFLSGMYGSEVIDVVSSYKEAGLPPAVFAAAVPKNYQRQVSGLIEEVYADHNAMKQRAAQRAALGEQGA